MRSNRMCYINTDVYDKRFKNSTKWEVIFEPIVGQIQTSLGQRFEEAVTHLCVLLYDYDDKEK